MKQRKPILHARDHLPGGADPLPIGCHVAEYWNAGGESAAAPYPYVPMLASAHGSLCDFHQIATEHPETYDLAPWQDVYPPDAPYEDVYNPDPRPSVQIKAPGFYLFFASLLPTDETVKGRIWLENEFPDGGGGPMDTVPGQQGLIEPFSGSPWDRLGTIALTDLVDRVITYESETPPISYRTLPVKIILRYWPESDVTAFAGNWRLHIVRVSDQKNFLWEISRTVV
jgi:hypothetical protein